MSKTRIVVLVTVAVIASGGGLLLRDVLSPQPSAQDAAPVGQGLEVVSASGERVDLGKGSGRLRVVHFWATWCPPCVEELPGLVAFASGPGKDPRFEIFGVSVDDDPKAVKAWLAKKQIMGLPLFFDPRGAAAARFGTVKFPETWFLGPEGRVLAHWVGARDWADPASRAEISSLLGALRAPSGNFARSRTFR